MKFVHLAATLLLLHAGHVFAQPGQNGPSLLDTSSSEPGPVFEMFEVELEHDNINRIQSPSAKQYFNEVTLCLLNDPSGSDQGSDGEDNRLIEKTQVLERKLLLFLDEQTISDPEVAEEGMERLANEIKSQQIGQIALLSEQLSTVQKEYQSQANKNAYLETFLEEDLTDSLEPVQWLVQIELGEVR